MKLLDRVQSGFGCRGSGVLIVILFSLISLLPAGIMAAENDLGPVEAMVSQGQYSQALSLLEPLLRLQPKHVNGRFLQARILFAQGKQTQAEQLLQDLSHEQPNQPEIYNNLAAIYVAQGDFNKARIQLELALATHSGYQTAYDNLGVVYDHLASQAYHQALSPDETLALPAVQLAVIEHLPTPVQNLSVAITVPDPSAVPTPDSGDARKDIRSMVNAWAEAWSSQQPERYLEYYDEQFTPKAGLSRKDWVAKRRVRLRAPKYIRVNVDNIDITEVTASVASVYLYQHYESDQLNDRVRKNLIVRKDGGKWRIIQENLIR
jgi:tetratricopeptide (TPR) repeat protein